MKRPAWWNVSSACLFLFATGQDPDGSWWKVLSQDGVFLMSSKNFQKLLDLHFSSAHW